MVWPHESLTAGVIAFCDVVELEVFYGAQSPGDRLRKKELIGELFGWAITPDNLWVRAPGAATADRARWAP